MKIVLLSVSLIFTVVIEAGALAQSNAVFGQIIREARCKILINASLDANAGDVLDVTRRPDGKGQVLGQVRLLKITDSRTTAAVVGARRDCSRLIGAFVVSKRGNVISEKPRVVRSLSKKSGSPSLFRGKLGFGPGLSNSSLRGISREEVVEDYPLFLTTLSVSGEVYPFLFGGDSAGLKSMFGVEGHFVYTSSVKDVRVTVPSPFSGQEVGLDLAIKRISGRGGAVLRAPLWSGRLFGDLRGGYFYSALSSQISQFVNVPSGESKPLEISPLRDLGLSGGYVLAGLQFQPVSRFRARLNAGTLVGLNSRVDNRIRDSAANAPIVSTVIESPTSFLIEAQMDYFFSKVQLGVLLSMENFAGTALFPSGQLNGEIRQFYLNYGLQLSFLP